MLLICRAITAEVCPAYTCERASCENRIGDMKISGLYMYDKSYNL
jgi:hypothetical protein